MNYKKTLSSILVITIILTLASSLLNFELVTEANVQKTIENQGDENFDTGSVAAHEDGLEKDCANLIVGINSGFGFSQRLADLKAEFGLRVLKRLMMNHETLAFSVSLPASRASDFTERVLSIGIARYVRPRVTYSAQFLPNDPNWTVQWAPKKIMADWAWNTTRGNSSVLVAVVDTGIDYVHPDLVRNYVPLGFDWVNNDTDPNDDNGHGTHVAGIVAASLNNAIGIAGTAQIQIMAEKGLDSEGSGSDIDLANAIVHAADQGAKIISMSWGSYGDSQPIREAIEYAYAKGALLIAAAGNGATTRKMYPAALPEVIAVAATDQFDESAWFSNSGDWIELAAPGVNIYSTISQVHQQRYNYPYDFLSGTSMAAPYVSGVAALVWSRFRNATSNWVRYQMRQTAVDLGETGFDYHYGHGRINALEAVNREPPEHDLVISDWQIPPYVETDSAIAVKVTVFNFGKSEDNATVELLIDDIIVSSASAGLLKSMSSATLTFQWTSKSEGKFNITSWVIPAVGETSVADNSKSEEIIVSSRFVALFQNVDPWNYPSNQKALAQYLIPCVVFDSSTFGSVDLSRFIKVVIAADQDQSFYIALNSFGWWFDQYVQRGGILEIHAADGGSNQGYAAGHLPGGLIWKRRPSENITVLNDTHPILRIPIIIGKDELDNWDLSAHGYFLNYPQNSQILAIDQHYGGKVLLVFSFGNGTIIASGLTMEWAYERQLSRILENSLLYTISDYPNIIHDVTVTNVTVSATSVYPGTIVNVLVTIRNDGNATESPLVKAYYGNATFDSKRVNDLSPDKQVTLAFVWNTGQLEQATSWKIWAETTSLLNEVNITNNVAIGGYVKIRMLGDINNDDKIDMADVILAVQAYGSKIGQTKWNEFVDLAPRRGIIDIFDIITLTSHLASTDKKM